MKPINTARVLRAVARRVRSIEEYEDLLAEMNSDSGATFGDERDHDFDDSKEGAK